MNSLQQLLADMGSSDGVSGCQMLFASVCLFKMRLLLCFAVAIASFEEAQRQPFEGYCAKAPGAQQSGFPEAPPDHVLQDGG